MRTEERVAERVRGLLGHPRDTEDHCDTSDDVDGPQVDPDRARDLDQPRDVAPAAGRRPTLIDRLRAAVPVRVPARVDPGRRAAVAMGVAVLLAAIVTGGWLLSARPQSLAVSASTAPIPGAASPSASREHTSSPSTVAPTASSGSSDVVVDVAGKVARPGLYHLPAGARVADALAAAGGAAHGVDLTSVNLAARVSDGQQIVVGVPGAAPAGTTGGATGTGSAGASGPVDLNTATLEQLETLPGIGPALAQRILDWRAAHGSFRTVEQLNDVSGIGDTKFAALRPRVSV